MRNDCNDRSQQIPSKAAYESELKRHYANAPLGLPSRTIFWQYA